MPWTGTTGQRWQVSNDTVNMEVIEPLVERPASQPGGMGGGGGTVMVRVRPRARGHAHLALALMRPGPRRASGFTRVLSYDFDIR